MVKRFYIFLIVACFSCSDNKQKEGKQIDDSTSLKSQIVQRQKLYPIQQIF